MIIGITGATGQLGRLVVDKLKAKVPAADIVALARTPARRAQAVILSAGDGYRGKCPTTG